MDSEYGSTCFTSTNKLSVSVVEQDAALVWMEMRRASVDDWMGWLATLLNLEQKEKYKKSIPFTGLIPLLTDEGCESQVGRNYIAVHRNVSTGYFFLLIGSECGKIYACKASQEFIFYLDSEKRKLASVLKIGAVSLPTFSVSVGHRYL